MTNTLAIWLFLFIIGFFLLDYFVFEMEVGLFVARKGIDLIQVLAIWR
ncbi:hypothetical protein [Aestuariibius sp. HNIBRBA575]